MLIPVDFEYNQTAEPRLNLVSCALKLNQQKNIFWLHRSSKQELINTLNSLPTNSILLCYNATAEARSIYSLGLNPLNFRYIDLYLEYRCLLNHNHELMYGRQLIDGVEKITVPPKYGYDKTEEEEDEENSSKPNYSLAAACYKLLNLKIDTEHKNYMRDLIISNPVEFNEVQRKAILDYNESDIDYLELLLAEMIKHYKKLLPSHELKHLKKEMLLRGEYAARTALMESIGYPIDYEATKNFSSSVPSILFECQKHINELFPEIKPFRREKYRFAWDQKVTRNWIESTPHAKKWMKTDGGKKGIKQFSLKLDAFRKFYDYRHDYPDDCLGAQFVRYLNLKQNLNGFLPGSKKGSFWDYVGSDQRVRPYFGIYGAQSARSQPKATGFLFLKSAWMRSLCKPKEGRACGGIDYSSQEFLVAALLSGDEVMITAYQSGDPYLYLAKLAGQVPWDGKRKDYERVREQFKSTTLGISYSMTKIGLAAKLTNDTGIKHTEQQAQKLIDIFNSKYRVHYRWKNKILRQYKREKYLKIPCGWVLFGDNKNDRSVGNFPVQGFSSSIMRKAVALAQDSGLEVILTLHDAIYIEFDAPLYKEKMKILAECMDEAFKFYWPQELKKYANIRLEGNIWSPDYTEGKDMIGEMPIKIQPKYLDKRGAKEYDRFKEYLAPMEFDL